MLLLQKINSNKFRVKVTELTNVTIISYLDYYRSALIGSPFSALSPTVDSQQHQDSLFPLCSRPANSIHITKSDSQSLSTASLDLKSVFPGPVTLATLLEAHISELETLGVCAQPVFPQVFQVSLCCRVPPSHRSCPRPFPESLPLVSLLTSIHPPQSHPRDLYASLPPLQQVFVQISMSW